MFSIDKDFILGAASSAWQTEGYDGKKPHQNSYIDAWYRECPYVWHNGLGPNTATNFKNQYPEDTAMMKTMGLTHYRTSINWARFLEDVEEVIVDEAYATYIDEMLDAVIAAGTVPMLCLEHYELPEVLLTKYGGWNSKKVVELYLRYAEEVFKRYAYKVKDWFAFNEPVVVQTRVFLDAIRWPFQQDTKQWMQWNYHKVLATASVVELYHSKGYDQAGQGRMGTILNPEVVYARSSSQADQDAKRIYDLFFNRVFLDPAVHGVFPEELLALNEKHGIAFDATPEELAIISRNPVDYLGINLYYPKRVKAQPFAYNPNIPFHPEMYYADFVLPGRKMNPHRGWEIFPQIVYDMGMRLKNEYNNIPWILTENGMGVENEAQYRNDKGYIEDDYRIDFVHDHLEALLKAKAEGSNAQGYMMWAFTDCVSPMNAFKNRYGFVEIDLEHDNRRVLKKSGYWYQSIIAKRVLE